MDEPSRSRAELSRSFGSAAATYHRGRPSYPAEVVGWLVPPGARDVADVGAGTGKLTEALLRPGRRVVAVDPDASMLEVLRGRLRVEALVGEAERLPLADASMDALTFGQAWHWVDPERACAEAARVLRPGGVLGLVWNLRDERVPWVAKLSALLDGVGAGRDAAPSPEVAEPFDAVEQLTAEWSTATDLDGFVAMVASRSYVITAAAEVRARLFEAAVRLVEPVAVDGLVRVPYVSYAFRTRRP